MRVRSAKDFGKIVKNARKQQGLTQPQLAGACGTGVRFIVDLENGKPTCEIEKALWIAVNLGINFDAASPQTREEDR